MNAALLAFVCTLLALVPMRQLTSFGDAAKQPCHSPLRVVDVLTEGVVVWLDVCVRLTRLVDEGDASSDYVVLHQLG